MSYRQAKAGRRPIHSPPRSSKKKKMFGRGTADDKGPAIAAIYAMRAVKELGYPLKKKMSVLSSVPTRSVEALTSNIIIRKKWKHHAPSHRMPNSRSSTLKKAACAATSKKHPMPERQACASYPYRPAPKLNVVPGKAYAELAGMAKRRPENLR